MYLKVLAHCSLLLSVASFVFASDSTSNPEGEIVTLKPFVVVGAFEKAVLNIDFRYHMMWKGVKKLNFKVVPSAWAKAGVKVGDRVTRINGQVIEGIGFKNFSNIVQEALKRPTIIFEVRSDDSDFVRNVEVRVKLGEEGEFMIVL